MQKKNLIMGIVAAFFVAVSWLGTCQAARPNVSDTVGVEKFIEEFNRIASEDGIYRITKWEAEPVDGEYQEFACWIGDKVSPLQSIELNPLAGPDGYLNSVILFLSPETAYPGRAATFIPAYIIRAIGNTDVRDTNKVTECVNRYMQTHKSVNVQWESSNGKVYVAVCDKAGDGRFAFAIYCPSM